MKKLIILLLICTTILVGCKAQTSNTGKYPIYTPVKISGSLELEEQAALPTIAVHGDMVRYNDTTWIYAVSDEWKPLFPITIPSGNYVPLARTVNGKALSSNISITASDVGLGNVTNESKATMFTSPTFTGTPVVPGYVPTTRTINGQALTQNITISAGEGTVTTTGTPVSGQMAVLSGTTSITSSPKVTIASDGAVELNDSVDLSNYTYSPGQVFTMTSTKRLKPLNLTIPIGIEVTIETLISGADSVFVIPIPDALAGMNIIKIEAQPGEVTGDRTMSVKAYRNRAGTVTTITSTGASFSTPAVINTSYDDLQKGDRIYIGYTFTGGTTTGKGLWVTIYAQKP